MDSEPFEYPFKGIYIGRKEVYSYINSIYDIKNNSLKHSKRTWKWMNEKHKKQTFDYSQKYIHTLIPFIDASLCAIIIEFSDVISYDCYTLYAFNSAMGCVTPIEGLFKNIPKGKYIVTVCCMIGNWYYWKNVKFGLTNMNNKKLILQQDHKYDQTLELNETNCVLKEYKRYSIGILEQKENPGNISLICHDHWRLSKDIVSYHLYPALDDQ
eukprot:115064_1